MKKINKRSFAFVEIMIVVAILMIIFIFSSYHSSIKKVNNFIIPIGKDFYQCETWSYECDDHKIINIPSGKFWGLIRMYNIAGWDDIAYLFENRDELIKWHKERQKKIDKIYRETDKKVKLLK